MLANSKGHKLLDHSIAVANMAKAMALHTGLPENLVQDAYISGLLHDIGKAIKPFQEYIESKMTIAAEPGVPESVDAGALDLPRHHEISWAFLVTRIDRDDYARVLSAIYWHHARPIDEKYKYFETDACILRVYDKTKPVEQFYSEILSTLKLTVAERSTDNVQPVPTLFQQDVSLNKSTNAEYMSVRGCLISADRLVSSLSPDVVSGIANGSLSCNMILSTGIAIKEQGTCDQSGYDFKRLSLQKNIAESSLSSRTTIVKAPAGFGKTVIGLLWGQKIAGQIFWVCPRNSVAEAVFTNIRRELDVLGVRSTAELYLTGERKGHTGDASQADFASDIVVTNIDNLLSPMVNNRVADRLFRIMGGNVVFDEFHEFATDSPLFAAFITLMRLRHRVSTTARTLLLREPRNTILAPHRYCYYSIIA